MSDESRLTLTVDEAGRLLGVSRMTAYAAVRDGTIPSLRIGRRVLVPRKAFMEMLARPGGERVELSAASSE
jgi:excisionase family DNA binding protein